MKLLRALLFTLILLLPSAVLAELPKQVERDFATVSGHVIMPLNNEYLIDLDDRDNLYVGDVLTLVKPGEKIYHPQTKELLGVVDIPVGYLQVTRIKSGYSYTKPLSEGVAPENGAKVVRFEKVPALLVDQAGDEGVLARQLQAELPQFEWLAENQQEQALLTFILKTGALDVKTSQGIFLHNYAISGEQRLIAPAAPAQRPFVAAVKQPEPSLMNKVANSVLGMVNLADDNSLLGRDTGVLYQKSRMQNGAWMGPNITGNPVGIAVADLDGDGRQETAIALDHKLLIARITDDKYEQLAEVEIPLLVQAYSLDALDLDHNGRSELYLTAVGEHQPASLMVEFTGADYKVVVDGVKWFLRVVEMPGSGRTLIGQEMGNDIITFSGDPFYVRREGNRLIRGDSFKLPGLLNIFSFLPFTDQQNKLFYAHLTRDDHLEVFSAEGDALWESEAYYGGSESCFVNREQKVGELAADTIIPTCVWPRITKTANGELLVVQNDGQRIMQRYRIFKKSRLVAMRWNGFALNESWRTVDQQGYLGDYTLADADNDGKDEVVMGVKFQHAGLVAEARSTIVTFDLSR